MSHGLVMFAPDSREFRQPTVEFAGREILKGSRKVGDPNHFAFEGVKADPAEITVFAL